jgi:hypothetical protein
MNRNSDNMLEKDLYLPVKEFFEFEGYIVKGEVKGCDVVAVKDDEMIIIEQKLHLNLEVVMQAVKRQRIAEKVYIAIPMPKKNYKRVKNLCVLLRRLELGLILIKDEHGRNSVRIELEPAPFDRVKSINSSKKTKLTVKKEFEARHGDYNTGGVTGEKLVTAYREKALFIAGLLQAHSKLSIKNMKELGADDKTYYILFNNYYGWFKKVEKGQYSLTEKGLEEAENYSELIELLVNSTF